MASLGSQAEAMVSFGRAREGGNLRAWVPVPVPGDKMGR